jgi:hypothetical protein
VVACFCLQPGGTVDLREKSREKKGVCLLAFRAGVAAAPLAVVSGH